MVISATYLEWGLGEIEGEEGHGCTHTPVIPTPRRWKQELLSSSRGAWAA